MDIKWVKFKYIGKLVNKFFHALLVDIKFGIIPIGEVRVKSPSCVQLFVTPWTIQSVEVSKLEYWSG